MHSPARTPTSDHPASDFEKPEDIRALLTNAYRQLEAVERHGHSPCRSVGSTQFGRNISEELNTIMKASEMVRVKLHNRPAAVVMANVEFDLWQSNQNALVGVVKQLADRLAQITTVSMASEFDTLMARMNTPEATRGVDKLFSATEAELGATHSPGRTEKPA